MLGVVCQSNPCRGSNGSDGSASCRGLGYVSTSTRLDPGPSETWYLDIIYGTYRELPACRLSEPTVNYVGGACPFLGAKLTRAFG